MRVITGTARGRKLKEPDGLDIRPTAGKVKAALFNIIQFDIEGRRVLDLFAGTGQLGIEALSRGAAEAVFVDERADAIKLVRHNLEHCGLKGEVIHRDALRFLETCGKFDLIFVDPPYDSGLTDKVLQKVSKFDILSDGGIIVCENTRETVIAELTAPYHKVREYGYGRIKLTKYEKRHFS